MKMTVRNRTIAASLLLILFFSGCRTILNSAGQELESVPGAFTFEEGTTSFPDLYARAVEHLENHEYAEAEAIYRELIVKEPRNISAYIGFGTSLNLQGRPEEAQEAYLEALTISPDSVEAFIGLGSANVRMENYPISEDFYTQALALDEANPHAHWGLALALHRQGKNAEAIDHLERILELVPGSSMAKDAENLILDLRSNQD